MISVAPVDLENYCTRHSSSETQVFTDLARETYQTVEWPQMQVGHLEGAFLRMLVRISRAQRILEIGTFTGYSTLAMAEVLPPGGTLVTCDINPVTTALARKYWDRTSCGRQIESHLGPAIETIQKLPGHFDLVFIDADKENYISYWEAILPRVKQGGLIVADNVLWSGKVLCPKEESDYAIVRFNQHVKNDPRVDRVMLTVRDGITLAVKL